MKFKLIFALFNGIILISFLFVFLMPVFILGFDSIAGFWAQNWYLILVFIAILGVLDGYFIYNWKTFSLLEREDWSSLADYLEKRVFALNFSDQSIRLLCNAWVVQGRPLEILRLEQFLRAKRPSLIAKHGLLLGIPYLMKNDPNAMIGFFQPLAKDKKAGDPQWMGFNYAFSLLAQRQVEPALEILGKLALQKQERIVQLLSLYLAEANGKGATPGTGSPEREAARKEFRQKFSASTFARHVERFRENLEVVILSKFIAEAASWMFPSPGASAQQ